MYGLKDSIPRSVTVCAANRRIQPRLTERRLLLFFQPRPRSRNKVIPVIQQRPLLSHKFSPKIVRAYVKRLRNKLGDDTARPAWIYNERGVGYRMARPGEA